jgi:mRNA interferase RelE/StbE
MYEIIFDKKASGFFKKLDSNIQTIIGKKIEKLKENPYLGEPLVGNLVGLRSLRIEKYRVIYKINNNQLIILILDIGHRKNIYMQAR